MMLGFDVDYAELAALNELFSKITPNDYLLVCKADEIAQEAFFAGKKVFYEMKNSFPFAQSDLDDDLFEDGFISVSVLLSNSEAAALSKFVRLVKINDIELILCNKRLSKEANNGVWVIKEALQRWGTNLDLPNLS
jgi:hypothetical protein